MACGGVRVSETAKLFLIDVMPLLYRGHFVFLKDPRVTSTGINTSALTGFANCLLQILNEHTPTHVALVLDSSTPTFRHEAYPLYKAQRQKMPEDLAAAIPMSIELAEALRIPILRVDGFEADDVMGTLAARAAAEPAGWQIYLATPDKDVAQLVGPATFLFRPGKAGAPAEIYDEAAVCRHWGVSAPGRMIDFLGLAGDASDNIPGIPGVGEKTATTLLAQFGDLENVLAHAAELKGKLAEKVAAGAVSARQSRELAAIRTDVPLAVRLDDLARREPDEERLRAVLKKYELTALGKRLLGEGFAGGGVAAAGAFQTLADVPHTYVCVTDEERMRELLRALEEAPEWAFDTETTGLDPRHDRLVGLSFATAPGRAWYVPMPQTREACRAALQRFAPCFADPFKIKIGHNAKFDLTILRQYGIALRGELHDSMLAHYVIDASDRHGMDHLARQYLHYSPIPITALIGEKKRGAAQGNMGDRTPEEICDYAAEDADVTLRLDRLLRREARETGCLRALTECEEPLVGVLLDMESEGVRINDRELRAYGRELDRELLDLEIRIRDLGGGNFNPASPKQLGEILFDHLRLDPDAARTASGQYATGEEVLLKLRDRHPIVPLILEYRMCGKLRSTYVDKLPECIDPATGRVHTTFAQALTETGRLSSAEPNLQNIPVRTERGQRIRSAFVARDADHVLLSADYSQIELRVMAALSRDPGMLDAFRHGADIHRETAARVYGVPPGEVTPEMRSVCKMVNFGIIYGISAFGLSQRLDVPRKQAAQLIETYFTNYPGVKAYMEQAIVEARAKGYAQTLLGRRRFLRDIDSRNATSRQSAERNAINTPVQGTAADLIKLAMVRVHRELGERRLKARMVLQIHDELLFDVPRDETETVRDLVTRAMTTVWEIGVPLEVSVGTGETWLAAH
ncbi:MAG: DNA polymerase I [Kiritimatiellia bacterium]|jgi:DNA polymerase-1|nr:DNA polymerase I [Kiritimatiellia bacterium]